LEFCSGNHDFFSEPAVCSIFGFEVFALLLGSWLTIEGVEYIRAAVAALASLTIFEDGKESFCVWMH